MNPIRVAGLWIVALLVFIGTLFASHWQYERHLERTEFSSEVNERLSATAVSLNTYKNELNTWQRVLISGEIDQETFLIRNRPLNGRNGFWIMSTIRNELGIDYPILLGWIPATGSATEIVKTPTIEPDIYKIEGILRDLESRVVASDLPLGQYLSVDKTTLSTSQNHFVQVLRIEPAISNSEIQIVPVPNASQGPHFFYSIQWLIFGIIALVGAFWLTKTEAKLNVKA